MNRIAPVTGYDFDAKHHYRRQIWNTFLTFRKLMGLSHRECPALLLPSAEGLEIEVAQQKGWHQDDLICVDRNPAIVATLKRRFPKIGTYGVRLGTAARRIHADSIRVGCANLDLCSNVSEKLLLELAAVRDADIFPERAMVAVTVLRGREWDFEQITEVGRRSDILTITPPKVVGPFGDWLKQQHEMFASLNRADRGRMMTIRNVLRGDNAYNVYPTRVGTYFSGKQTMFWNVFSVHKLSCNCRLCLLARSLQS